ncbi:MAG: TonB family protein [Hyphomicrobiales bacterium]|nr:TonB family protein [Hyphomicrobiales bacterium]
MTEAELNTADRVPQAGDAPEPWSEDELPSAEPLPSARAASAPVMPGETLELGSALPSPPARVFLPARSEGGLLATAGSLAAHAFVIAALLLYAPWDGKSLQDEDEISIELVDALPQSASPPEPVTSRDQAQPAPPEATSTETQAAPTLPPAPSEASASPPAEAEAATPPESALPPVEDHTPPSANSPPLDQSEAPPPPPPPEPVENSPPVRATEPVRTLPLAVDPAQRERAQRLEREKREEAERVVRERAARAAENVKRQEAQRQVAERQEAQRQAAAKAAEAFAANAAAASAYRGIVIGHLASFKRYPPAARARGAQGNPAVSFSIDGSGHVISVSLTRGSGDPDIDAEIVAMVHRASPFPTPPPGAPHVFSAGVNFRLQ